MIKRLAVAAVLSLLLLAPSASARTPFTADGHTVKVPRNAPARVQRTIMAANRIVFTSYCYNGGHYVATRGWDQSCYDCSGAVSYTLHGGGFLGRALNSREFRTWGRAGPGRWITVYSKDGHTYAVIAGRRFDTLARYPETGEHAPRWRHTLWYSSEFVARHPVGY